MAVLNDTSHPAFGQGFSDTIIGAAYRAIAMLVNWNDCRVTRNSLGRLSDRELDDIGLTRGNIHYIR